MQNSLQAGTLPVDLNGAFHRQIPLDQEIKEDEIKATYKEGILRIELPKAEEASGNKSIPIKTE